MHGQRIGRYSLLKSMDVNSQTEETVVELTKPLKGNLASHMERDTVQIES